MLIVSVNLITYRVLRSEKKNLLQDPTQHGQEDNENGYTRWRDQAGVTMDGMEPGGDIGCAIIMNGKDRNGRTEISST